MNALRRSPMLARLVLVWFGLMLGTAAAAPIVKPDTMTIVCSTGGSLKVIYTTGDGHTIETGQHSLDCPLCMVATLLPPEIHILPTVRQALPVSIKQASEAHVATLIGPPLPARGPPQRT